MRVPSAQAHWMWATRTNWNLKKEIRVFYFSSFDRFGFGWLNFKRLFIVLHRRFELVSSKCGTNIHLRNVANVFSYRQTAAAAAAAAAAATDKENSFLLTIFIEFRCHFEILPMRIPRPTW